MTATQRTLRSMREFGCRCAMAERWNQYAKIRQDPFGFIDIICIAENAIIAVQSCSGGYNEHKKKIIENSDAMRWIIAGGQIELWSWRKLKIKRGGKAYKWEPRVYKFTDADFKGGDTN